LLELKLQLGLTGGVAASAGMSGFPLIAADEKVLLKLGHSLNLQESQGLETGAWRAWEDDAIRKLGLAGAGAQKAGAD
jgi:hypothetical protein